MEESAFLARFAITVTVIHRRTEFRASRITLERVRALPGMRRLTPYVVEEFLPREGRLVAVHLRHAQPSALARCAPSAPILSPTA